MKNVPIILVPLNISKDPLVTEYVSKLRNKHRLPFHSLWSTSDDARSPCVAAQRPPQEAQRGFFFKGVFHLCGSGRQRFCKFQRVWS